MTDNDAENAVAMYSDTVYRLAYARTQNRADADDVYQEVFLRFIRKDPPFVSEEHRKAWFIRVTVNCAAKLMKKRAKSIPSEEAERIASDNDEFICGEEYIELREALSALPPKYREVIHLYYFDDMPAEQIAKALGRRKMTVLSQLSRGRQMLKKFLEEEQL